MRNYLYFLVFMIPLISCNEEYELENRELNISFKSTESVSSVIYIVNGLIVYPNPFKEMVTIHFAGTNFEELIIYGQKGGYKKISINSENVTIDFSEESSGVYYCEAKQGNKIYRTNLIKE